jgi:hypothetical protein
VTTVLYILLGLLVVVVIAMQVWAARTAESAGSRSGTVAFLRIFNIVLLVGAIVLVIYALVTVR